ncbi:MAG: glycosyltransferase [Sphingobacteriia bacterium]|nr:glycosyltransferase [Sphingobacteriia bacterium]
MIRNPELSIIMPLFNNERYVGEAVESLLGQSYGDFELIVVDDGSQDGSVKVVSTFRDKRIKILHNESNQGIVFSRNKGLNVASGRFIAPFDSDDVALPEKFKLQINYLKKNPRLGAVGSWVLMIDKEGNLLKKKWKLNAPPERILSILLFRNFFVQSAMVMRREAIPSGGYAAGFDLVEDYRLWYDMAKQYHLFNYPDYLVKYRIHQANSSNPAFSKMRIQEQLIARYIFSELGIKMDEYKFRAYFSIKNDDLFTDSFSLKNAVALLHEITSANCQSRLVAQSELRKVIFNRLAKICFKSHRIIYLLPLASISSLLLNIISCKK